MAAIGGLQCTPSLPTHVIMASQRFHCLFDTQAGAYSSFWPGYTSELFGLIYSYAPTDSELAVDVATGSGQAAQHLDSPGYVDTCLAPEGA